MTDDVRYFCTYLDHRYIPRFLLMYNSLVQHCPTAEVWVLALDNECFARLISLCLKRVRIIRMSEFEESDPEFAATKSTRSAVEYYFTCTPVLPLYVLRQRPSIDLVTYVDADFYFYSSVEVLYRELGAGSIGIVSHRFPARLQALDIHGKYNVGVLCFRNDSRGLSCLEWWRAKCIEWCYDILEDGKFADQKYLDDWPTRFEGVVEIENEGVNVAPWNVDALPIHECAGRMLVGRTPLVCYHFQGVRKHGNFLYDLGMETYGVRPSPAMIRDLYRPYLRRLLKATAAEAAMYPSPPRLHSARRKYEDFHFPPSLRSLKRNVGRTIRRQYIVMPSRQKI